MLESWFQRPKVRLTFWQRFAVTKSVSNPVRHATSFNKSQRGKARRAERKFKLRQLAECVEAEHAYIPHAPLHNRKEQ